MRAHTGRADGPMDARAARAPATHVDGRAMGVRQSRAIDADDLGASSRSARARIRVRERCDERKDDASTRGFECDGASTRATTTMVSAMGEEKAMTDDA